jgi:lipopolysaccharide export system permease protein
MQRLRTYFEQLLSAQNRTRARRKIWVWWWRTVPRLPILQLYLLKSFLTTLFVSLFVATTVFLVFDFFERVQVFFREDASLIQVTQYVLFKIPLVVQLMMPIAVLVSILLSVGRLSQLSEITAMRACGVGLFFLARPLIYAGVAISMLMLVSGETLVPWSTKKLEELYQFEIQKKAEKGRMSRSNFWHRSGDRFYSVDYYDSGAGTLYGLSVYQFRPNTFKPMKRLIAESATWKGPRIGWVMNNVVELTFDEVGNYLESKFSRLPLVIPERPADFYSRRTSAEALNYRELRLYIEKLRGEGVPVSNYEVELQSKLSFPMINMILVLVAFPFALLTARSGTMTKSFVAGVSVGFGYYVVHAVSLALGSAELVPIIPAAWTANILLGSLGGYLIMGAENA